MTDVILASGKVDPNACTLETTSGTYRPVVLDFSQKAGKKRFEEIRAEVAAGTFRRWLELVVLPLYGKAKGDERARFVEEVIRFEVELVRGGRISPQLTAATLVLSNKMIDKKRLLALWEELKMLDIVEIAREKGIEEGKSLGIEEGKSLGIQEGKALGSVENAREMLLDLVLEKFGIVPDGIQDEIGEIGSLFSLKSLFRQACRCNDMEAFEAMLRRVRGTSVPAGPNGLI